MATGANNTHDGTVPQQPIPGLAGELGGERVFAAQRGEDPEVGDQGAAACWLVLVAPGLGTSQQFVVAGDVGQVGDAGRRLTAGNRPPATERRMR